MSYSILHIDTSIKADGSVSKELTRAILDKLLLSHPEANVTRRDLGASPLPEADGAWLAAVHTPAEARTEDQQHLAALSDQLIAEVRAADVLVIGLPVYNFTVPSQLKIWLDQLARAGETFRYTENGPEGLIRNTRAIVAYSSGGTRLGSEIDFASGYLRHMLGFFGITEVEFIASDFGAIDADASRKAANDALDALAA